ncbi:MAG: helix-turn-helix transcriptional regulator [Ornithinibacter sp.]
MLRRGHVIALRLGAMPLLASIEALGRTARISLATVEAARPDGPQGGDGLDVLTRREREVVAHVVAGRTYAEIATALFLSEKTVSSHISNLLRKTGTANRIELATWAVRVAGPG